MSWLQSLFFKAKGQRRELVCVTYTEGDNMLRDPEGGWHLAPEEDKNKVVGTVYLERWSAVNERVES
jgi:hypothetical protein